MWGNAYNAFFWGGLCDVIAPSPPGKENFFTDILNHVYLILDICWSMGVEVH